MSDRDPIEGEERPSDQKGRSSGGRVASVASMGRASALGFEFVGTVTGGGLAGYFLDRHFHTQPWCLLGAIILFSVFGLVRLVMEAKDLGREQD